MKVDPTPVADTPSSREDLVSRMADIWQEDVGASDGQAEQEVQDAAPYGSAEAALPEGLEADADQLSDPVDEGESDTDTEADDSEGDPAKKPSRWQKLKMKAKGLTDSNAKLAEEKQELEGHLGFFLEDNKLLKDENTALREELAQFRDVTPEELELAEYKRAEKRRAIDQNVTKQQQLAASKAKDAQALSALQADLDTAAEKTGLDAHIILAEAMKSNQMPSVAAAAIQKRLTPNSLSPAEKQVLENARTPAGVNGAKGLGVKVPYKPGSDEHALAVARKYGLE